MQKSLDNYLKTLKERKKTSRVYFRHQSLGLLLTQILSDSKHKALYIKLAREHNAELLLAIAKDIASRGSVRNKGAYFMKVFAKFKKNLPVSPDAKAVKPKQLKLKFRPAKKRKRMENSSR